MDLKNKHAPGAFITTNYRPQKTLKHKVRMLVAVTPRALIQIIEYLFRDRPEFELLSISHSAKDAARQGKRLRPELIAVNVKPLTTGVCGTVRLLKRSSPSSKLILILPVKGLAHSARSCGADACVDAETLLDSLLSTAQRLASTVQSTLSTTEGKSL